MSDYTKSPWHGKTILVHSLFFERHKSGIAFTSRTDNEVKANAGLIIAAPEMYEALKTVDSCLCWGISDSIDAMKDIVIDAIKKAEGKL